MCWTVFLCWEWGLSFHILLDPLMQIADSPFLEEKSLIYMNRPRHLVTLTQIISESLKSPQVPHTLWGRIKQAHTIYTNIHIISPYTQVSSSCRFDCYVWLYQKNISYYSYIVSIYHQFIFEILWDYTCLLLIKLQPTFSTVLSLCYKRPRSTISTKKLPESTLRKEGSLLQESWSTTGCTQPKPKCRNQRTLPKGVWNPDVCGGNLSNSTPSECPRLFTDGDSSCFRF